MKCTAIQCVQYGSINQFLPTESPALPASQWPVAVWGGVIRTGQDTCHKGLMRRPVRFETF